MNAGSRPFEVLLGQQATPEQHERLRGLASALGIRDNDAIWTIFVALELYVALYEQYPLKIAEAARRALRSEITRFDEAQQKARFVTRWNRIALCAVSGVVVMLFASLCYWAGAHST